MELSRTSTRLFFLAAINLFNALYNTFMQDWVNVVLPILNFMVVLFAFAAIENEIEKYQRNRKEVTVVEHI